MRKFEHLKELYPRVREEKLLDQALAAFYEETRLRIDVTHFPVDDGGGWADAEGRLMVNGVGVALFIELKAVINKAAIGVIAQKFKELPGKGLLITKYVNPRMAERLREMDIWFLDTVGNVYINEHPVFIYIKGNKAPDRLLKRPHTRAFQATGLKVVYAFLCNPDLVNAPYRDIAEAAQVALGTVGWVVTDLKKLGHIIEMGRGKRRLKGKKKLFDRWVEAYPERLRPKLVIGRFTTDEPVWWKNTKLEKFEAYKGGETGAEYLTHYLRPEKHTIYVRARAQELQLTFRMRKDPTGEIELLEPFWNQYCDWKDRDVVHPILVYADLMATGDPRNIETAEMIYERELDKYFRED